MTLKLVLILYGAVGVGAGTRAWIREGAGAGLLMVIFWPFLLPLSIAGEPPLLLARRTVRSERLAQARSALQALRSTELSLRLPGLDHGALVAGFLERLLEAEARLAEIDRAIETAVPAARSKLEGLRESTQRDLEDRLRLVEELIGQMTVLRFADLSLPEAARTERDRLEALVLQLESLTEQHVT